MYNTSSDYKEYIKKPSRSFESKVVIGTRTFNNDSIIQIVPNTVQPKAGFAIGNTVSQSIDITLKNDNGVYASVGVADVEIGLKIGNTIEYIPIGKFNIDSVTKTDYTVKLTCYDNMIRFETGYFSSLGDTPTLQEIVNELVSITGVEFTGTVPNYTVTKLQGYTCREILAYVASVCGGNAYITRDGKFTIVYPTEVDCTITADNYINAGYKLEDTKYKVGMITCQNKSKNDSSDDTEDYDSANSKTTISVGALSSDTMELQFENPWVTESILNDIYNKLKNFSYLGYTLKWQGDLSLDVGDIITVIDKNNVTRKAYVYANKLTYTGGLIGETSAKGETKNSNSFNSSGPSTKDIQRISVKLLIAEKAIITKANIKDLQATNARIENLDVAIATIDTALINYATVTQLDAVKANVANLNASVANIDNALINKANVADLDATKANISNLNATVANIQTLIGGNLTIANMQSLVLSSDKVTVTNGFIKNAMIESLDVTKINAGTLNTNKISVSSSDGGLVIAGATQQFKDKNKNVRLQMGQDTTGEFSFILVGKDGKSTLIDSDGIHEGAIADGLIKTDMVADQAISSDKINYSSFATGFNAATNSNYINASKVEIDLTGQTLDIAFNNINTKVDGVKTTTGTNTTSINAIQGQISTLISNTTITKDGTTTQLKDAYNGTVNTINSMQTTIGEHTTEINANTGNITSLNSSVSSIQASLTSISASLSDVKTTANTANTNANNAVTTANKASSDVGTLTTAVNNTVSRISSLELTTSGLTTRVGNTETAISSLSIGGRNVLLNTGTFYGWNFDTYGGNGGTAIAKANSSEIPIGLNVSTCTVIKVSFCNSGFRYMYYPNVLLYEKTYTFSAYVFASNDYSGSQPSIYLDNGNRAYYDLTKKGTWQKLSITVNFTSSYSHEVAFALPYSGNVTSGTMFITMPKLEEGNKTTDWTPAPQDVDGSITSVKDYATTTINSAVSTINQTTNSIQANVSSLQSSVSSVQTTANTALSAINNLSIGGRNLLRNSNFKTTTDWWYLGSNVSLDTTTLYNGSNTMLSNQSGFASNQWRGLVHNTITIPCTQGEQYTASIYTMSNNISGIDNGAVLELDVYDSSGNRTSIVTSVNITPTSNNVWKRFSVTGTIPSGCVYVGIYAYVTKNGKVWFARPKLERGNQVTDWIPAPEDVDSQISTINTNVSNVTNRTAILETSVNGINATITTINSNVSTVTSNLNNLSIGSRNLYINSRTQINYANATKDCTAGYDSTCKAIRVVFGNNPICRFQNVISKNGTYSVSFYAKSNTSSNYTLHCDVCDNYVSNSNGNTVTTSWKYYKFESFVIGNYSSDTYNFVDIESSAGADILISHLIIVEGSKATTWTPAPEDTQSQITTINSNVTTMQSSISTLQSRIALKVEQSNIDSAITTVNNKITATNATISSMQSSINMQLNSITSKVSQASSNKNLCVNSAFKYDVYDRMYVNISGYSSGIKDKATYTSWGYSAAPVASDYVWYQQNYSTAGEFYITLSAMYAKVKPNTNYTVSFYYVMGDSGTQSFSSSATYICGRKIGNFGSANYDYTLGSMTLTYSNDRNNWRRCVATVTTTSDTDSIILRLGWNQLSCNYTEILVAGVQIEEGSSVTDWVEGTYSVAGTTISQNSSAVMTSFNNISKYFQVSADGAKFGDTVSGDYTTLGSEGMKHHVGGTDYDYMYVTYYQDSVINIIDKTYSGITTDNGYTHIGIQSDDYIISYDSVLKAMLNGRKPKLVLFMTYNCVTLPSNPTRPSEDYFGCSSITSFPGLCSPVPSSSITCDGITIKGYQISYAPSRTEFVAHSGGAVRVSFLVFA